jgi:hypothetical protein
LGREQSERKRGLAWNRRFGREFVSKRAHFFKQFVSSPSFLGINPADGKADMNHDVISYLGFGHEIQAGLAQDAAELDSAGAQAMFLSDVNDFSRNCQAHESLRRWLAYLTALHLRGHYQVVAHE